MASPSPKQQSGYDAVIVGAGLAGLTMAVALRQAHGGHLNIALVDARLGQAFKPSGRAYALAAGVCQMLDALDIWSDQGSYATMVEQDALWQALERKARAVGVTMLPAEVVDHQSDPHRVVVTLDNGAVLQAKLLIACDGAQSMIRKRAGIAMISRDYDQSGIVMTLQHERPHDGVAEEHFLPSGPFATLPLTGNRCSIVWTERTGRVKTYLSMANEELIEEIEQRFGLKRGRLTILDRPKAFPLRIGMARRFIGPRLALVGDAAHLIHPIAGQGLNLGLRDVAALAELVSNAVGLGLDCGAATVLEDYEQARRFDTVLMGGLTDALNRLFSNDITPLRLLRSLGLGLVDRMPRLKNRLISEASAVNRHMPKLLRGGPL